MGDGIGNGKQSDGQNLLVRRLGVSGQYGFSLCSIDSCGKGGHYKFVFFWGVLNPENFQLGKNSTTCAMSSTLFNLFLKLFYLLYFIF
jgi:hypothetical protein